MFYFLERQAKFHSNLVCQGEVFSDVFLEGLDKVVKYHKNCGPFMHYVITNGYKGPVVWETVPADASNLKLIENCQKIY